MTHTAQILQFDTARRQTKVDQETEAVDTGWIKSYRKRLESDFARCPVKYAVWDYLLHTATHKPRKTRLGRQDITLQPGQLITSQRVIMNQFNKSVLPITRDIIRGALDYFVREGMIQSEGGRTGSVVTIVNWGKYQGEKQSKIPPQIPHTIPPHDPQAEAPELKGCADVTPKALPHTEPKAFPTIQEDNNSNTNLCSNTSLVTTNVETTDKLPAKRTVTDYPEEFEWMWQRRPRREGSDNKRKTLTHCRARIKEGATWNDLIAGMFRYGKYCKQRGQLHTPYTMQMCTFFGTGEHYKNDWTVNESTPATGPKSPAGSITAPTAEDFDDTGWIHELEDA
ncbi:hypothetical protein [Aliamphritea hakodatensis]|uniref:hypothetical protein n=1 Tax=Aliamphritea hakodatensis TaxID=2895352 RepID=UPI0022FD7A6B|nr:hypothetical protein [Aliamphritea hakodatensis]